MISIIGPGSLGSAFAVALRRAGHSIAEILHRDAPKARRKAQALAKRVGSKARLISKARIDADIVWLCVPDRSIASVARELAAAKKEWKGIVVLHSSGALPSDEMSSLRKQGAATASLHPLMTFVPGVYQSFTGVPFAAEGDEQAVRIARRIVRDLEGQFFALPKSKKAAYHAWGAFTSPLLLALLVTSEQVAKLAGLGPKQARRRMLPIVLQTIENYVNHGPARAFSGPILRGDIATLESHLRALRALPQARAVYRALATAALETLPATNRKTQERLLLNR